MHGTCGAGEQDEKEQQEGWAEEQRGGGEDTCDCDSESHSVPWSRAGTETCSHDGSKPGQEKGWRWSSRVGRCKELANTARRGGPLGVKARGEGEGGGGREGGGDATARAMR